MSSDLITHLSGNVPIGIWLVPVAWGALSIIWFTVWWGTGFWGPRKLFTNLIIILFAVPALYSAWWHADPPHPKPVRIIAYADVEQGDPSAWKYKGYADIVRRNFELAGEPFVVLKASYIPALWRLEYRQEGKIDSIAGRQIAHWLIKIAPGADGNPVADVIDLSNNKKTQLQADKSAPFHQTATDLANKIESHITGKGDFSSKRLADYLSDRENHEYQQLYEAIHAQGIGDKDNAIRALQPLCSDSTWIAPRQHLTRVLLGYLTTYHRDSLYTTLISTLQHDDRDPENYVLLGRYFLEFSMWEEAEGAIKLGLRVTKNDPRLYFYMARLDEKRLENMEWGTRQELLERALYLAPGYENARIALADYHILRNAKLDAELILEDGLTIDPGSPGLKMKSIANLIGRKKFAEAEGRLQILIDPEDPDPNMLYNLGIALIGLKRYEEAIAVLDSSFAIGWNADNIYYKALAYKDMGEWDLAIRAFQRRMMLVKSQDDRVYYSSREWIKRIREWQAEADSLKSIGEDEEDMDETTVNMTIDSLK